MQMGRHIDNPCVSALQPASIHEWQQQACQVEGPEIICAPVNLEAVLAQGWFLARTEHVLVNARVVDQYMQPAVMVLPIPRCESVDAVDIAQVKRMGCYLVLVGTDPAEVALQRIRHGCDVASAGNNDRGAPTRKDPGGFVSEGIGGGAGDYDTTAGHVDLFRRRMACEQTPQVMDGLGQRTRHPFGLISEIPLIGPTRPRSLPTT